MLEKMDSRLSNLELGQVEMKAEISTLKQGQSDVKTEMNERFDRLESELKYAWQDIGIAEKRIQQHEKEFHTA